MAWNPTNVVVALTSGNDPRRTFPNAPPRELLLNPFAKNLLGREDASTGRAIFRIPSLPSLEAGMADFYDVVVVGAGAAGLSAAIVLGRCRRHVFRVRCGATSESGVTSCTLPAWSRRNTPRDLLDKAKFELERHPTVKLHADRVTNITLSRISILSRVR